MATLMYYLGRLVRWILWVIGIALIAVVIFLLSVIAWNKVLVPAWDEVVVPVWHWAIDESDVDIDEDPTPTPQESGQQPMTSVQATETQTSTSGDSSTNGTTSSSSATSTGSSQAPDGVGVAHTYEWATGDILGDGACYMKVSGPDEQLALENHGRIAQGTFVAASPAVYTQRVKEIQDAAANDPNNKAHTCPIVQS